jgi:hypothetical protein
MNGDGTPRLEPLQAVKTEGVGGVPSDKPESEGEAKQEVKAD